MTTYKDAGVDIDKADNFITNIKKYQSLTEKHRKLFNRFGMFSACYSVEEYKEPVIVTTCDGIGTKIELLKKYGLWETAGRDLAAMNVNDIITTGADPVMFMDYIGISSIDAAILKKIIKGISDACIECSCILAGGETAEMPGIVPESSIELSGFCTGIVEKSRIIDPTNICEGDIAAGIKSNGFHANGYSLIRKIIETNRSAFSDDEIIKILCATKIYYNKLKFFKDNNIKIKGIANITGGGIPGNLSRIIPESLGCSLTLPEITNEVIRKILSFVDKNEAQKVFNLGIGMIIIAEKNEIDKIDDDEIIILGEIQKSPEKVKII